MYTYLLVFVLKLYPSTTIQKGLITICYFGLEFITFFSNPTKHTRTCTPYKEPDTHASMSWMKKAWSSLASVGYTSGKCLCIHVHYDYYTIFINYWSTGVFTELVAHVIPLSQRYNPSLFDKKWVVQGSIHYKFLFPYIRDILVHIIISPYLDWQPLS